MHQLLPVLVNGCVHIPTTQCHCADICRWCHSCSRRFLIYLSTLTLRYPDAHCRSWCLPALWSAHAHPSCLICYYIQFIHVIPFSICVLNIITYDDFHIQRKTAHFQFFLKMNGLSRFCYLVE
nr:MAG TPA: hypothetical protein [Bacteriophage sp.]